MISIVSVCGNKTLEHERRERRSSGGRGISELHNILFAFASGTTP